MTGGVAAAVHKQALAWGVALPQGDGQLLREGPATLAEGAVGVALGMRLPVLLPEQLQGDPFAAQLAMHPRPIGLRPLELGGRRQREQRRLQGKLGQGPANAGEAGPRQVLAHRGGRGLYDLGDLSVGATACVMQPQYLFDLAQDNLRWAIGTPGKTAKGATVIPRVVLRLQVSSSPWNRRPLWRGIRRMSRQGGMCGLTTPETIRTPQRKLLYAKAKQETA